MTTLIFVFLAAVFAAAMDKVQFHYLKSVFSTWKWLKSEFADPKISWLNKYKDGVDSGPKFWGSTTIFVFVTDLWHLLQFCFYKCMFLALVFYSLGNRATHIPGISPHWIIDFILYHAVFTVTKEFFFSQVFHKK